MVNPRIRADMDSSLRWKKEAFDGGEIRQMVKAQVLVIFSPSILTAPWHKGRAGLSTCLSANHPHGLWKTCNLRFTDVKRNGHFFANRLTALARKARRGLSTCFSGIGPHRMWTTHARRRT
jgi:hypothetical protein